MARKSIISTLQERFDLFALSHPEFSSDPPFGQNPPFDGHVERKPITRAILEGKSVDELRRMSNGVVREAEKLKKDELVDRLLDAGI